MLSNYLPFVPYNKHKSIVFLKTAYGLVRVLTGARQTHLPSNIFCRYRELFHSLIPGLVACGESKTGAAFDETGG